ncbi:hypothetical protein Pcinc_039712 [Petrolisthes cinctipes]|uniref:Uncharacterized protein n=1 Tax=Petrolisthes cinctipes TaxID=88211 RepID=A0AAE1BR44_PETCI|nr:hypothetical protein Pcinc_039712 [Petrolisthes cinctipes]
MALQDVRAEWHYTDGITRCQSRMALHRWHYIQMALQDVTIKWHYKMALQDVRAECHYKDGTTLQDVTTEWQYCTQMALHTDGTTHRWHYTQMACTTIGHHRNGTQGSHVVGCQGECH